MTPSDQDSPRYTRTRTWFPVAQSRGSDDDVTAILHAVDGDGSAFCGRVPADALRPVADVGWYDDTATSRCRHCRIALIGAGADDA